MKNRLSLFLLKIPVLVFKLAYFVACLAVISVVAYFFGHFYLEGLHGTDTAHALSLVSWVAKYFPKIPFWYHLQGAGVSMKWSYPLLASILVVLADKLTHLGILASFQVMAFSSLLLTAFGMYLFVWLRLKNQTAALIASIFYLITPLSYAYFADWGFYAEAISCMFFFPPLIFYDLFLEGFLSGKLNFIHRLGLFLAALFAALLFNAHPNAFFSLFFIIGFQTILRAIQAKPLRFLFKAFFPSFLVFLLTVFLAAFVIFNFTYYESVKKDIAVKDENLVKIKEGDFEYFTLYHSLPRKSFLGLELLPPEHFLFPLRNISILPLVWILALAGMVLTLFFNRKVFAYIFPALFGFGVITYPAFFFGLIRFLVKMSIPGLNYFLNQRVYLTMVRNLFPIAAAFGIVGVGRLLFEIPTFWRRWVKNKFFVYGFSLVRDLFVAVFALTAFLYLLYYTADKPESLWNWYQAKYGFWPVDIRSPFGKFRLPEFGTDVTARLTNLRFGCVILEDNNQSIQVCSELGLEEDLTRDEMVLEKFEKKCRAFTLIAPETQLCPLIMTNKKDLYLATLYALKDPSYWQKPDLFKPEAFPYQIFPYPDFIKFIDRMAGEKNLRVDVSPTAGGVVMGLNAVSDMSMVSLYAYTASLIGPYWGHEQQVLFQKNDGREETATEVAKWFGTKYLLTNPTTDPTDKYFQKGGWEAEVRDEDGRAMILKLKDAPDMATWTKDKPTVLVIGNKKRRVFEPIFRASNKGALPYEDFWLVEGEERIDSYSLEELKKFDILYLFGYSYKSQNRAWGLIDSYLKDGGKVFLSTGWQYVDKDWMAKKTPAWFPATSLSWSEQFNKTSTYNFDLSAVNGVIDVSQFGPLEWNGVGYGVSVPKTLRQWAKPVLSVEGTPLVAVGEYGQGKVVWSGLNSIGHMHTYGYNDSEILFHRSLFDWLRGPTKAVDLTDSLEIVRNHPDKVSFEFDKTTTGSTTLYWRESAFPSWQAKFVSGKKSRPIKIYYGGPRLMLMQLDNIQAGDKLILEFKPGIRHLFLKFVSVVTFLGLVVYLILGQKIYQPALTWLNDRLRKIKSKAKAVKESWGKEEE